MSLTPSTTPFTFTEEQASDDEVDLLDMSEKCLSVLRKTAKSRLTRKVNSMKNELKANCSKIRIKQLRGEIDEAYKESLDCNAALL